MNAKTEEFLYLLLWGAETLARPTLHRITESYESWAYRKGLKRHLRLLEARNLVERSPTKAVRLMYRLTEAGRLAALGHRDPEACWRRRWDGQWRMVVFDVPEEHNAARVRLRRFLKARGYGCLQRSVWITPDPVEDAVRQLAVHGEDVRSFVSLEARPCSGGADGMIVTSAWDFDKINDLYREYLGLLAMRPKVGGADGQQRTKCREWAHKERAGWHKLLKIDPLLPRDLLPAGYLGQAAWRRRGQALKEAGCWLKAPGPF